MFQNDLMQLIQYAPTTEKVLKRPLLIAPPWINKFYILDLRPRNVFVRWAVAQGHTVFMISWVNPDEKLAEKGFEDYMKEGYLAALDAIEQATGEREVNAIGYCLGGTLLASTLAYMAAKSDNRISSATFFVTMTDFEEAGELGVFIDEEQLQALEEQDEQARLSRRPRDGDDLQHAAGQRPDLVLRGEQLPAGATIPFPFDLLYWNADSTRMPARMHSFYLRKMYQQNLSGGARRDRAAGGVPIDLRKIKTPSYFLSDAGGPYRAVEDRPIAARSSRRADALRAGGAGPYRRRGQPARRRQIQPLDQRGSAARSGGVVQGRDRDRRVLVAGLAPLGRRR